ncbi:hypothetical protein RRG08_017248 [Elysia crispata]|uniref:Heat shock protein 70 n=1 Tax=Elysia crispata TaxID=231223 RepID=A0AAE1CQL5_9GAST|nr:hypothetical protein RRG08_017248 [Elysia crispata]
MLAAAERYREEHEKQRERVSARKQLESYVFSVKQALDTGGDKLSSTDKDALLNACNDTLSWLDSNTLEDKEEYEHLLKELQKTSSPAMTKLRSQGHGQGQDSSQSDRSHSHRGPTIEEID